MPVTIDGTSGITTPTYNGADTSEYIVPVTAFKNRIINGSMMIDQRNAGASVTPTATVYGLDRWRMSAPAASKYSFQQNAGSVTPPAGFTNYLGITSLSAYSITATDAFLAFQLIEGFNVADFAWGTANAATITLSFWVRSSLTGTFGGALGNVNATRSYPFTYTISSANTWEYKTITIAGDTTGTWNTTNSVGLALYLGFGVGSTYSGTAGAWVGAERYSATGATSVVGTNGATFYITGVQLEKGSTATSFDYRPYGTELALCQRYFLSTFPIGTAPAQNVVGGNYVFSTTISNYIIGYTFPVQMRASPTITTFNPYAANASFRVPNSSTDVAVTPINATSVGISYFLATLTAPSGLHGNLTASAEL